MNASTPTHPHARFPAAGALLPLLVFAGAALFLALTAPSGSVARHAASGGDLTGTWVAVERTYLCFSRIEVEAEGDELVVTTFWGGGSHPDRTWQTSRIPTGEGEVRLTYEFSEATVRVTLVHAEDGLLDLHATAAYHDDGAEEDLLDRGRLRRES